MVFSGTNYKYCKLENVFKHTISTTKFWCWLFQVACYYLNLFYFHLFSLCVHFFNRTDIPYSANHLWRGHEVLSVLKSELFKRFLWKNFNTTSPKIYQTCSEEHFKCLILVLVFHPCDVFHRLFHRPWTYFRNILMCGSEASQSNLLFTAVFAVALLTLRLQAGIHPHSVFLILKEQHAGLLNTMGPGSQMRRRGREGRSCRSPVNTESLCCWTKQVRWLWSSAHRRRRQLSD